MKISLGILAMMFLGGCVGSPEPLVVKQFLLRDQKIGSTDSPMVTMEKARRLRGAISMDERRDRLGQYYTLIWNDPAGVDQGEVELVFEYLQGATASRVKRVVHSFPSSDSKGTIEIPIIGDLYFKGGKVLAWKATLRRGGREISTQQSYLWQ